MTTQAGHERLFQYTDSIDPRAIPSALLAARRDVLAALEALRSIPDAALSAPWAWKGGSEEEIRYGFYRVNELFERAGVDADAANRRAGLDRGRTADIVAPATASRWEMQGLLIPLDEATWDAPPGGEEWTIRQTLGHVIAGQRAYAVTSGWWHLQALPGNDPDLPRVPEAIFDELPSEEAEGKGTAAEVRERLDDVLDRATERLSGLPEDRLAFGARWSGFPVDIGFRMARWSSHIREHTIQVEKTLEMLGHRSSEVDRLTRLILAAWGRAEAEVYGQEEADEGVALLAQAAGDARQVSTEIAGLVRPD